MQKIKRSKKPSEIFGKNDDEKTEDKQLPATRARFRFVEINEVLPVKLNESEQVAYGSKLANFMQEETDILDELSIKKAEFKTRLAKNKEEILKASRIVREKSVYVEVACLSVFDLKKLTKILYRGDTYQSFREESMTTYDRQHHFGETLYGPKKKVDQDEVVTEVTGKEDEPEKVDLNEKVDLSEKNAKKSVTKKSTKNRKVENGKKT
jgi:hypothetical protein